MNVYTPTNVIVHEADVHFESRIISKPIHVVQYDDRLPVVKVNLYTGNNGDEQYALPEGADVNIRYCRPDGHVVYNPVLGKDSTSNNVVYFEITQAMLIKNGKGRGVLEVTLNGKLACSSEIIFEIDRNPIQEDSIEATDEFKSVVQYAAEAESAASSIRDLTVEAITGEPGSEAAVEKSGGTGPEDPYHLTFTIPKGESGSAGNISVVAEEYSASKTYKEGKYVIYNNDLYVAKVDISTAEAWNANHWTRLNIGDALYDQKVKMDHKADIDGSYEDLTAGSAEQLLSSVYVEDSTPYSFRPSGGNLEIGNREEQKKIVGVSVVQNQLINPSSSQSSGTTDGVTVTNNNDGSYTITGTKTSNANTYYYLMYSLPVGSKYVICGANTANAGGGGAEGGYNLFCAYLGVNYSFAKQQGSQPLIINPSDTTKDGWRLQLQFGYASGAINTYNDTIRPMCINLTQRFGVEFADWLYSLSRAQYTEILYQLIPELNGGFIPHNTGVMGSVNVSKHRMTQYNQWDEEWEVGAISSDTGLNIENPNTIRSVNYIKVIPDTTYYFQTPNNLAIRYYDINKNFIGVFDKNNGDNVSPLNKIRVMPINCYFIRFQGLTGYGNTYNNDICISFYYDGERAGEYEPFKLHEYDYDSSVELRGMLKVDENGNIYADGDEYNAGGSVKRKWGYVDLGSLNYVSTIIDGVLVFRSPFNLNTLINYKENTSQLMTAKYPTRLYGNTITATNFPNKSISGSTSGNSGGYFYIRDDSYSSPNSLKSALSGVYLIYELDTQTEETANPFTETQVVDNWGTEEFVDAQERSSVIPVGQVTDYLQDLKAKLETVPNAPSENGDYLVRQSGSGTEYVPYTGDARMDEIEAELDNKIGVITISDPTTTMGDISEVLTEVNTVGDHVLFDVASLGASMHMCTIFIDTNASKYKIVDLVNGKVAEGAYASSLLLTMALAQATDIATHEQVEVLQREIDELGGKSAISDWAVLGDKIQDGTSTDFIKLGDRVDINWIDTVLGMTSKGLAVTCSDKNKFINAVGEAEEKQYLFVYDGNSWTYEGEAITLADYGLNVAGTPTTGEVMTISTTVTKRNYTFTSYDTVEPSDASVAHNWLLEETYAPDVKALDTYEALFAVYQGKTVPVGNYHLRNYSYRSGFYVDMYLGVTSPIGSNDYIVQARSNGYLVQSITNADAVTKADVYSISGLTPTIYGTRNNASGAVSITYVPVKGVTYTELTALNVDENSPVVYAYEGVFDKCALGSNNWERSNLNTWLNDDTGAKASGTPSYELDVVSPFNLQAGFLYGIDPRAKALIQNADVKCMAGYGDEGYTHGQIYIVSEKVFLLSMREMSFSINDGEGVMTGLYGEYTNNTVTDGAVVARAKYNKAGGTLNGYRWSRSALAWYATTTRIVSSTGGYNVNYAVIGYYYASAFIIGKSGNQ